MHYTFLQHFCLHILLNTYKIPRIQNTCIITQNSHIIQENPNSVSIIRIFTFLFNKSFNDIMFINGSLNENFNFAYTL